MRTVAIGVAGEVGQRPGLAHHPVDADDEADAVDQVGAVRLQATGQGRQTRHPSRRPRPWRR